MATFNPLNPLQSSILELLIKQQEMSVATLHVKLKKDYGLKPSLQNLYKIVSRMLEEQMLVKANGKLLINLVWLSHLTQFTETAKSTYLAAEKTDFRIPFKENERSEFSADSLNGLDPIWNHVLLKLKEYTKDRTWHVYNSHPWYVLGMRETETRLYTSLVSEGIGVEALYGNNTFLDEYGNTMVALKGFRSAIMKKPPFPKEGYALWICGEYIVECVFPNAISRNFQFFFQTVQSIVQFEPQLFSDTFTMKARCKITVRKSPKESATFKKYWREHFE